jgi:hypothetical protein
MTAQEAPQIEAEYEFLQKRDAWIDFVVSNPALGHATARVGVFIARRMNATDQKSWWGVETMAKEIGCSTKTVSAAISELEAANLLAVVRRKRGGNTYFLHLPYSSYHVKTTSVRDVKSTC